MTAEIYFGALDLSPCFLSMNRVHDIFESGIEIYHLRFQDSENARAMIQEWLNCCEEAVANVSFGDTLPPLYIAYREHRFLATPRIMGGKMIRSWCYRAAGRKSRRLFDIQAWGVPTRYYYFCLEFISEGAKRHDYRTVYRANKSKQLPLRAK